MSFVAVTLTTSDLQSLGDTPVDLVAAPGAGYVIIPERATIQYKFNTSPFKEGRLSLFYAGHDPNIDWSRLAVDDDGHTSGSLVQSFNMLLSVSLIAYQTFQGMQQGFNLINQSDMENVAFQISSSANANRGPILTSSLNSGGSGYVVNDVVTVLNGDDGGVLQIDSVDGSGAVLTYHRPYPSGLSVVATGVATAYGSGSGMMVDILTVDSGDGSVVINLWYDIIAV